MSEHLSDERIALIEAEAVRYALRDLWQDPLDLASFGRGAAEEYVPLLIAEVRALKAEAQEITDLMSTLPNCAVEYMEPGRYEASANEGDSLNHPDWWADGATPLEALRALARKVGER